jgi:hypothetical protein
MNNLKRFTVCKLAGHDWSKVTYPPPTTTEPTTHTGRTSKTWAYTDGEATGTFLRCQRCGKEDHAAGTHARGGGGLFFST